MLVLFWNRSGQYVWEDHRPRSGLWKGTAGGEAISISGCDDDQTSADTSVSRMSLSHISCICSCVPQLMIETMCVCVCIYRRWKGKTLWRCLRVLLFLPPHQHTMWNLWRQRKCHVRWCLCGFSQSFSLALYLRFSLVLDNQDFRFNFGSVLTFGLRFGSVFSKYSLL